MLNVWDDYQYWTRLVSQIVFMQRNRRTSTHWFLVDLSVRKAIHVSANETVHGFVVTPQKTGIYFIIFFFLRTDYFHKHTWCFVFVPNNCLKNRHILFVKNNNGRATPTTKFSTDRKPAAWTIDVGGGRKNTGDDRSSLFSTRTKRNKRLPLLRYRHRSNIERLVVGNIGTNGRFKEYCARVRNKNYSIRI